jgi:hypothetical protein
LALLSFFQEKRGMTMHVALWIVLFFLSASGHPIDLAPINRVEGNSAAAQQVEAQDDLYTKASNEQDLVLLSSVWANTFIDTSEDGTVRNKTQMLAALADMKRRGVRILSISISNRRTDVYGSAAVVTGMFTTRALENGRSETEKGRFTDVWIKRGDIWLCVAAHSSSLSSATGRHLKRE